MSQQTAIRVVCLVGEGDSSWIVCNALRRRFDLRSVIVEPRPPKVQMVKRRAKRLGIARVVNQLAFQLTVPRLLAMNSAERTAAIRRELGFDATKPARCAQVETVNDATVPNLVNEQNPDVVVINGTRIVAARILDAIHAPIINTHAGITPRYRGVHGGYWALRKLDPQACGVTVHLVDPGIDTGGVLAQACVTPTPEDNFVTYPLLQLGSGIELLTQTIPRVASGDTSCRAVPPEDSKLYYHPGLSDWLYGWWKYGVR